MSLWLRAVWNLDCGILPSERRLFGELWWRRAGRYHFLDFVDDRRHKLDANLSIITTGSWPGRRRRLLFGRIHGYRC
jgi:hypothetical protein